jgi:hypothetical protein
MKKIFLFTIFSVISICIFASDTDKCNSGFSSNWGFDQNKKEIKMLEIYPMEVCNSYKNQLNANLEIKFFSKDKLVYAMKLFWEKQNTHDVIIDRKMSPFINETINYKIIKIPIKPSLLERYEVVDLTTDKVWGNGIIK